MTIDSICIEGLLATARRVDKVLRAALRAQRLDVQAARALRLFVAVHDRGFCDSPSDMAGYLGVGRSAGTKICARLEKRGLLRAEGTYADWRAVRYRPTRAGVSMGRAIDALMTDVGQTLLVPSSDAEKSAYAAQLDLMTRRMPLARRRLPQPEPASCPCAGCRPASELVHVGAELVGFGEAGVLPGDAAEAVEEN